MRILPLILLLALAAAGLPTRPAQAQNAQPLVPYLLGEAADTRADDIAALLTDLQAAADPDHRTIFDLMSLQAERLSAEDRLPEAFQIRVQLAVYARDHRDVLFEDPAPLLFDAADLAVRLGFGAEALQLLTAMVTEQRDAGLGPEVIAETQSWITRLTLQLQGGSNTFSSSNSAQNAAPNYTGQAIITGPGPGVTADSDADAPEGDKAYTLIDVYYGTDRARTGTTYPSRFYGSERGKLELGVAAVSIPRSHQPGAIESRSYLRFEFRDTPVKHIVVHSIDPMESGAFFDGLSTDLGTGPDREIFIFVHGFNTSFEEALKRAAQLSYDMNFQGVPIVYSWPSRGKSSSYMADSAVVRLSGRRLSGFIEDLVDRQVADRIHVVAHSMGSRAVSDALELLSLRLAAKGADRQVLDQVLFAAPDVDADLFSEMLPTIKPLARRVTLYTSEEDWALSLSRYLHGDAPRAGQAVDRAINVEGLDSIDMTSTGEDMLAHSYFANDNSALLDITTLFWRDTSPDRRCGLVPKEGSTWRYDPTSCRHQELLDLFQFLQQQNISSFERALQIAEDLGLEVDAEFARTIAGILE